MTLLIKIVSIFILLLCLKWRLILCCKPIAQADVNADVNTNVEAQANVDMMENLAEMVGIEKGAFDGFIKSGAFKGIEAGGVTGMQSGAIEILKNMREVVGMQSGAVVGMETGAVDIDTNIITDINADFGGVMVGIIAIAAMGGFIIMFSIAACLIKKIINKISQNRNRNKKNLQGEDGDNDSSQKSTTQQKIIFGVIILTVLGCYVFLFLSMSMISEVSKRNTKLKTQVKLNAYFIEFFSMNGQLKEIEKLISQNQIAIQVLQNGKEQDRCPNGWSSLTTGCYRFLPDTGDVKTIREAVAICENEGGFLAEIYSQEEQNALKQFNQDFGNGEWVWLGASDFRKEGEWKWIHSGRSMTFTAWGSGEPNNSGDEDCLCAWGGFQWVDIPCAKYNGKKALCKYSGRSRFGNVRSRVELIPSRRNFSNVTKSISHSKPPLNNQTMKIKRKLFKPTNKKD